MSGQITDIRSKAILVRLTVRAWSGRSFDRKATNEVIEAAHAAPDSGRFHKLLIGGDEFKAIAKVAGEARTFHYDQSLPWGDDESRILPATNYLPYMEKMRTFKAQYEAAVSAFIAVYDVRVSEAQARLNGLYNAGDYPGAAELGSKFGLSTFAHPVPDSADFRIKVSADELERCRAELETSIKDSIAGAMRELWDRLRDVLARAAEKLSDGEAIFRDSLIGNIRELCDLIPRLNIASDPVLAKLADELGQGVAAAEPEVLRTSPINRKLAADEVAAALKKVEGYVGKC